MASLRELLLRISGDPSGAKRALAEINRELITSDRQAKASSAGFRAFGESLSNIGTSLAASVTLPIAGFAGVALKAAGDIEALKLGLNSITKSAQETERQFAALREVAKLPGLGLEEAAQGATNLQALGFSFEKSRAILLNFGNALASVGRGRDDLQEVIRQLGQLGARGQVTADNLRPIIERVPQVAGIIKREFGGDALGNPAETFKKLGVSSEEFIDVLIRELGKIPQVTGGIKNDFENLSDSVKIALADAGQALAPFAKQVIDQFAVPAIASVSSVAQAFRDLSPGAQSATIAVTGFVATLPLATAALGGLVKQFGALAAFLGTGGGPIALGIAAVGTAIAVNSYQLAQLESDLDAAIKRYKELNSSGTAAAENLKQSLTGLQDGWRKLNQGDLEKAKAQFDALPESVKRSTGEFRSFSEGLGLTVKVLTPAESATKAIGAALEGAGKKARESSSHFKAIPFLEKSQEGRILAAQLSIIKSRYDEFIQSVARLRVDGGGDIFGIAAPKMVSDLDDLNAATKESIVVQGQFRDALSSVPAAMFDYAAAMKQVDLAGAKARQAFDTRDMEAMSKKTQDELKKSEKASKEFGRQVSLITNDVARNITDLIFKGGKFKDVMVDALESVAKALVRLALEKTLTAIAGKLTGILTSIPGIGKALGGLFGGAAGSVAGSVGGQVAGTVASTAGGQVAGQVIGGAISAGGSAASTAAGIAGQAAGTGLSAAVGIVTGAVSAISGVIGNFQFAAMNKSLDLIEKETRYSQIHLGYILEKLNQYLPMVNSIHDRLATIVTQGVGVYNAAGDGGLRLASGGSVVVNINGAGDPDAVGNAVVSKLRQLGFA